MTITVLIVDPDIAFTVPVKRALEQAGDFKVNLFVNGQAAVDLVRTEAQDVAVLDFNVDDIDIPHLINALRSVQPGLFILASPRTQEHVNQLPSLDVQGSITKPYLARQLVPVVREAVTARARLSQKEREAQQSDSARSLPLRAELRPDLKTIIQAELQAPPPPSTQPLPGVQSAAIPEPPIVPDDTFHRLVGELEFTGSITPIPGIEEPPLPEHATIRDLVSGVTTALPEQPDRLPGATPPAPDTLPEPVALAEPLPASDPDIAIKTLEAAVDDSIDMEHITQSFVPVMANMPVIRPGDTEPQGGIVQERLEAERRRASAAPPARLPDAPPTAFASGPVLPVPAAVDESVSAPPTKPLHIVPDEMMREPTSAEPEPESFAETAPEPEMTSAEPEAAPEADAEPQAAPETPADSPVEAQAITPATMAVQLTQLTVDSTAKATILLRGGELLASAGQLSASAVAGVVETINSAWHGTNSDGNTLIRFIHVPAMGDYMLYSTRTVDDMTLSMLFPAETPLRVIRQQATRLSQALDKVPEPSASDLPVESAAATTRPSRPTGLRPPEGLRAAVEAETAEAAASGEAVDAATPRAEGPYAAYAFVWLPRVNTLPAEMVGLLVEGINDIAAEHFWKAESIEVQPSYVTVQVSIPANETPTATVEALMRETATRTDDESLWADAYYIVAPGRAVTQQEIARFMEYRRDAQDAA